MRLAWAIVVGALGAGAIAWWLARDPVPADRAGHGHDPGDSAAARPGGDAAAPVLYRWRDDAGVTHVTDAPPQGRDYSIVDVDALARRNTIQPDAKIAAEAE